MSQISQFRSSKLTNGNQGGGNKLSGLFSSVGGNASIRAAWARRAFVPLNKRNIVFCTNQIGGIGRGKSMFRSTVDGVKCVSDTSSSVGLGNNKL